MCIIKNTQKEGRVKMNRNNKGRFGEGNKAAQKPILCPYCQKELSVRVYTYLQKKQEIIGLKSE